MKKVKNKLSLNKHVVTKLNNVTGGNAPTTKGRACTLMSCAGGLTCGSCANETCDFDCTVTIYDTCYNTCKNCANI